MATTTVGSIQTVNASQTSGYVNLSTFDYHYTYYFNNTNTAIEFTSVTIGVLPVYSSSLDFGYISIYVDNASTSAPNGGGTEYVASFQHTGAFRYITYTFPSPKMVLPGQTLTTAIKQTYPGSSATLYPIRRHSANWRTATGNLFEPPTTLNRSPSGTITSRTPAIRFQYRSPTGQNATMYRIDVRSGSSGGSTRGSTGDVYTNVSNNSIVSRTYNESNFPTAFSQLSYGQTYNYRIRITDSYGLTYDATQSFSIANHSPTTSITAPLTGQFDRTPQLVGTYNDSLGHSRSQTEWIMRNSSLQIIGRSVSDANNLTPTYDPNNTSFWLAGAQQLQYGQTYRIDLRVRCNDGQWSNTASRTFAIGTYRPTVTYLQPTTKVDTLEPTIEATYASSLGFNKTHHKFELWNAAGTTKLGETAEVASSSSPFSIEYNNSWTSYTGLQWGTTYIAKALVRDNDGNWSSDNGRTFKTNSHPTSPDNLQPNGIEVTVKTPVLSANFRDPDSGDTPTVMEVEMRDAATNALVFQRSEAGGGTNFDTFLVDNLQIDHSYQWRVRFTDQGGLQGAWSAWATFSVIEGAEITLINPEDNAVLSSPLQTFEWTYVHPLGIAQASGRLRIYAANSQVIIYDSGIVPGSYLSQELPSTLLQNNSAYELIINTTDVDGGIGVSNRIRFSTAWEGPPQPNNITATPDDSDGTVLIEWDTIDSPDFLAYRVYRRDPRSSSLLWVRVEEIADINQGRYMYYFAPSGLSYQYTITIVSDVEGAPLESSLLSYTEATVHFPTRTILVDSLEPSIYSMELLRNPSRSETFERNSMSLQSLGRELPVVHVGRSYSREVSISFSIVMPYQDILTALDDFIRRRRTVLYRDGRGRRMWIVLTSYTIQDNQPNKATLSLICTETSATER